MAKRIALYTGSFDPVTNGHLDVVKQALRLCDRLVIGIGVHPGKVPLFTAEERATLLADVCIPLAKAEGCEIEIITFDNLAISAAQKVGASMMIRGLRDGTDLDYEMQMAGMNGTMAPKIGTVFLPASPSVRAITATLIRQVAKMGGDISAFVPKQVAKALQKKIQKSDTTY